MAAEPERRTYESPLRTAQAEQTRASVLAAATHLFEERGWKGTGMRDVAQAARVSVETVYSGFGSKSELLKQVLDVAVVGDIAPVPLADRGDFRQLGAGPAAHRVETAASIVVAVRQRTSRLREVLNQAASGNSALSGLLAQSQENERESIRQGALAVAQRDVSDEEVDALFAILGSEVFLLLTEVRGWTVPTYQSWVAQIVWILLNMKED